MLGPLDKHAKLRRLENRDHDEEEEQHVSSENESGGKSETEDEDEDKRPVLSRTTFIDSDGEEVEIVVREGGFCSDYDEDAGPEPYPYDSDYERKTGWGFGNTLVKIVECDPNDKETKKKSTIMSLAAGMLTDLRSGRQTHQSADYYDSEDDDEVNTSSSSMKRKVRLGKQAIRGESSADTSSLKSQQGANLRAGEDDSD